jgi:precorrin-6B methylase 2
MRSWKSIAAFVVSISVWTGDGLTLFARQAPATPAAAPAPSREQWQRLPDVFRELGASPGRHIADIGAGGGFFTTRLAKAVGPEGRVYAVDVNPISLRELKDALGAGVTNVELIRGDENDPHLPAGRLDGALVVNAYHEFAEYDAMLRVIKAALKPDGRLVLIEPIPRGEETTRAAQTKRHTIAIEMVEEDLRRNGFEIVTKDPVFVTRPEHQHQGEDAIGGVKPTDWLLVARPRAGSPLF